MANIQEKCEVVATPNFPAYAISAVSGRYVIVGGGGGAARTGIKNKFDVYELYHNGKQTKAERVVSHDVGPACISNLATWCELEKSTSPVNHSASSPFIYLALVLKLSPKFDSALPVDDIVLEDPVIEEPIANGNHGDVRQRVQNTPRDEGVRLREMIAKKRKQERIRRESINSTLRGEQYFTFDVKEIGNVETVVRVSWDDTLLATGGTDGFYRVWELPSMKKVREVRAHEKEVDDLDFKPDGKQTNGVKYKFYRARYAMVEKNPTDVRLFTISNAVVGSKHPGIIAKWNAKAYEQQKEQEVPGTLSSLSISDNGRYLATGTMDGAVYILIAFSLQMLQKVEDAHSVFVTGLAWLPTECPESKMVRGYSEASVLSISCDNTLKIHHIPRKSMVPVWAVAVISVIVLFLTFTLASYLGL
ncbi:Prolactin regulatory element-binding protein [Armadillidium nasatum]|uniref:Prolactin regulatory element-binding protein n=1 Tax=Armadillidium nasatum TaxID=96803 RepID=A0A5N5SRL0_9CRUS|nr:Prolactin regulatory element-binding protein [Armadillidium nasatum]